MQVQTVAHESGCGMLMMMTLLDAGDEDDDVGGKYDDGAGEGGGGSLLGIYSEHTQSMLRNLSGMFKTCSEQSRVLTVCWKNTQ